VQFYLVNEKFYLVDLPGYGYAKVPKFLLLDVRRTPAGQDLLMHEWASGLDIDERVVLTKSDKLSNNQLTTSRRDIAKELQIDDARLISASAVTKQGIDQIRREIFARL
jgi:GTP-binding protein